MSTVLVIGANRGIGLGLVENLLHQSDPPSIVIATYRNIESAIKLLDIAAANPSLKILEFDFSKPETFDVFVNNVSNIVGENGLNVLINNGSVGPKYNRLEDLTLENYSSIINTNHIGPVFLTKALLPLIKMAAKRNDSQPMGMKRAVILNISSLVGSLEDNTSGKHYGYRESKAALNMFTVNLKQELEGDGILVLPLNPGWVRTDMGGPSAPISVETSAAGLVEILYTLGQSKNGQFLNYDKKHLPW